MWHPDRPRRGTRDRPSLIPHFDAVVNFVALTRGGDPGILRSEPA